MQELQVTGGALQHLLKCLDGARSKVSFQEGELQRLSREVASLLLKFKGHQEQCKTQHTADIVELMRLRRQLAEECFLPHIENWDLGQHNSNEVRL